jgi:cobalt/nickel transport system permease protein
MMLGHLTIAGIAELVVSAGVVAFLQKSDPSLLKSTAGRGVALTGPAARGGARSLRPLWVGLGALMILTPLGILAAGSAWGEWMASDFSNPAVRQQMAASSFQQPAPLHAPEGLERLSSVWTAPLVGYAPPYVSSAAFGYLLSAMFGAGLVMLAALAVSRFIRAQGLRDSQERAA